MDLRIFAYRKYVFFGVVVFALLFLLWTQSQISSELPIETPRHHSRTVKNPYFNFSNHFLLLNFFFSAQFFYSTSMNINADREYLTFIGRLWNESSKENSKNAIPFERHYFNVDVSDGLAIDRDVPDTRHDM